MLKHEVKEMVPIAFTCPKAFTIGVNLARGKMLDNKVMSRLINGLYSPTLQTV
mgnify:CR=1 FL=1